MFIDRLGIAHEGVVYVPEGTVTAFCYKVRVLNRDCDGKYRVIGEEEYSAYPTDDQIMWCIANYKGSQAVVEKVYWLAKIPFTEDM